MTVISLSMTPELLDRLDDFIERSGYSSRSEAIRLAIRDAISQFALQRLEKGQVMATVTVQSDRERHEHSANLMALRHEFDENIFSNTHFHLGRTYCIDVFIIRGPLEVVLDFIRKTKAIRGISEVKFTMTPIEDDLD
ncbi:CopG family ribbon-helix-helix protein [Candidatus Bathyarchaeota archaeon]|nr:CopG family ribbon-helix-helix protein [Candidatus Bathyarchaeota archaeon]